LFELEENGIIGAKLVYPDDTIQHAGIVWKDRKAYHIYKHLPSEWIPANEDRNYSMVTGAFLAIRKKDFQYLFGFDENFKNSAEDADLCIRMQKKGKKVLYSPCIKFVHLEGKTYGLHKTFDNENLRYLFDKHKDFDFNNQFWKEKDRQCFDQQFYPPYSIEIGSGKTPEYGTHAHVDIMPEAEHLELCCDVSKQLPFSDKTLKLIIANHVIEHISWRKINEIVRDWNRVLVIDGRVKIRTPNLEFIIDKYNRKQITPEAKQDEVFIKENFGGTISPTMYVILKLFSGQDYPSNFHNACYDYKTLEWIANRWGFRFSKMTFEREYSPGEIQCVFEKVKDVT
jgi:predicted SAM-dependent methyltransferase